MYDYLEALITLQSAPQDAYNKFDALAHDQQNHLREAKKALNELLAEQADQKQITKASEEINACMNRYVPALMAQAKIIWEKGDYAQVEGLFSRSAEYCSKNETWMLNLAHTLYMQEKYKAASEFYAPIMHGKFENVSKL